MKNIYNTSWNKSESYGLIPFCQRKKASASIYMKQIKKSHKDLKTSICKFRSKFSQITQTKLNQSKNIDNQRL